MGDCVPLPKPSADGGLIGDLSCRENLIAVRAILRSRRTSGPGGKTHASSGRLVGR